MKSMIVDLKLLSQSEKREMHSIDASHYNYVDHFKICVCVCWKKIYALSIHIPSSSISSKLNKVNNRSLLTKGTWSQSNQQQQKQSS